MNMATRRSSRVTKNNEKKEREQQLDSQVRSGTPDGLVLMDAGEMGRGVATLRKYKEGDLVCIYEGTLVPHKEAVRRYKIKRGISHHSTQLCLLSGPLPKKGFTV